MIDRIGQTRWVIAEGYIPPGSHGEAPEFTSHEAFCILNANSEDVHLELTIFYADRDPVGPSRFTLRRSEPITTVSTTYMIRSQFHWERRMQASLSPTSPSLCSTRDSIHARARTRS